MSVTDLKPSLGSDAEHLVYVPAFRCADTIESVFDEIDDSIVTTSSFLVIDNASGDATSEVAREIAQSRRFAGRMSVVQTTRNLGYSGSQKLAYRLARRDATLRSVTMLHADGQYPPHFLGDFRNELLQGNDVVYGYRSKADFGEREETPLKVRTAIRVLGALESAVAGQPLIREWHSGYVGYSTNLLGRINLSALTTTRHIDGNMLHFAHRVGARIASIPIYKRYRHYVGFGGSAAMLYIIHTLIVMLAMKATSSALISRVDLGPVTSDFQVFYKP